MTLFDDRERAFESKFAHDAEMRFRAEARRNRLLGMWAAELMGKSDAAAAEYAKEVVRTDFGEGGEAAVMRKVAQDLGERADEPAVRAKMDELLAVAKAQIVEEG